MYYIYVYVYILSNNILKYAVPATVVAPIQVKLIGQPSIFSVLKEIGIVKFTF